MYNLFAFFKTKPLQVVDFPRKAYEAYWEIHPSETLDGFVREVRILGYDGSQKDIQMFTAATEKAVDKKAQKFLSDAMQKQKRV